MQPRPLHSHLRKLPVCMGHCPSVPSSLLTTAAEASFCILHPASKLPQGNHSVTHMSSCHFALTKIPAALQKFSAEQSLNHLPVCKVPHTLAPTGASFLLHCSLYAGCTESLLLEWITCLHRRMPCDSFSEREMCFFLGLPD